MPRMSIKVSVVVPVYNPGKHIDPLISCLQRQSLPQSEFETIFVDDGSSDETPEKLDRLAADNDNVTVIHIPNSGWPGKPRNIGIETAVGEYVQFVDHDDELGLEALERMYAYATENGSDVVVGKEVRRPGTWYLGPIFYKNRPRATLENDPILGILTPHKMFRRDFLNKHHIRFFEGPRRMEDHPFVVEAFFLAEVISVLSDYPVYYWKRRADKGNAGARPFDWANYYVYMRDVLNVVERHTEPGDFRDRLLSFWYDSKGLGIVSRSVPNRSREEVRRHFDALRDLAEERFPPSVDNHLGGVMRVRSELLRANDFEGMVALGYLEQGIRIDQQLTELRVGDDKLTIRLRAGLCYDDGSAVTFESVDGRYFWRPPIDLGQHVSHEALDFTDSVRRSHVELAIRNRLTAEVHLVKGYAQRSRVESGAMPVSFDMTYEIDPEAVASGEAMDPAVYDMFLRVGCHPWKPQTRLRSVPGAVPRQAMTGVLRTRRTVVPFTTPGGSLAIDVDQQIVSVLDSAVPVPQGCRLSGHADGLSVTLQLSGVEISGRPLRGRLKLVPQSGGKRIGVPLKITGAGDGQPTTLKARIPRQHEDLVGPGRWTLVAVVQKRRKSLGLVVEVDAREGAALSTVEGTVLSRVSPSSGSLSRNLRRFRRVATTPRSLVRRLGRLHDR